MLPKIDIHTHIIPKNYPDFNKKFNYNGFVSLEHHHHCGAKMIQNGKTFRELNHNCWDANIRMNECKEQGVKIQVLSTIPVLFNYWAKPKDALESSKFLNEHIAEEVQKNPMHFKGLGTVPLQDPELAIFELERCVKQLGLSGVEIGSHVNDWNLNQKELFPFFSAACKLNASVFVHPWEMMGKEKMPDYWLPWLVGMPAETSLAICSLIFGGVFEKLPELRVCFAHGGGAFPFTFGRIKHGFNVRPDLCATDNKDNPEKYIGKFWVDSLVHDSKALEYLVNFFGEDKISMGSDYPFPLGEEVPGKLIESMMGLSALQKKKLLYDNAMSWLGEL
ncbi:MAG: 2-amino-3-carboxymuconate-6-semialdehyde decarboxylase [Bacteroidetes bacterium RIFCSPLOWO2_02_FULL_36_8]|nr:MAG: 2-amino-3-carboxymuconate-6-semialdehyde decarboxylase [Bacteroidetes bacterium RIFCSPLOWO2_02_FULL_36_8]OFY69950.1 MAG: 2-amino-3-carboxymuconate-6-semialdehyde decarboxylase [Bacteroidetes bacterium RIFCSPLOWO2_12_FULL_37_12]